MSHCAKCIKMLLLLSENGKMNSAQLANELQTNTRNIREYRKDLEECGFVFRSKSGSKGGIELLNCKIQIVEN
ncbi:MAG: hypothetical protein ACI4UK_09260 [Floccifex sp.]